MISSAASATHWTTSNATTWLSKQLQSRGVSTTGATAAASDLLDAAETNLAANPDESDSDFHAALDKQIDKDVSDGKLSQNDADKIKKALDQMTGASNSSDAAASAEDTGDTAPEGSAAGTSASAGAAGNPSGAGGGGGSPGAGGTSEKIEVSRTVTISGGMRTTVITYRDGTTDTETSVATQADLQKQHKHQAAAAYGEDGSENETELAKSYLAQTPPGTLIDKDA